jgi:hypothetical protein
MNENNSSDGKFYSISLDEDESTSKPDRSKKISKVIYDDGHKQKKPFCVRFCVCLSRVIGCHSFKKSKQDGMVDIEKQNNDDCLPKTNESSAPEIPRVQTITELTQPIQITTKPLKLIRIASIEKEDMLDTNTANASETEYSSINDSYGNHTISSISTKKRVIHPNVDFDCDLSFESDSDLDVFKTVDINQVVHDDFGIDLSDVASSVSSLSLDTGYNAFKNKAESQPIQTNALGRTDCETFISKRILTTKTRRNQPTDLQDMDYFETVVVAPEDAELKYVT